MYKQQFLDFCDLFKNKYVNCLNSNSAELWSLFFKINTDKENMFEEKQEFLFDCTGECSKIYKILLQTLRKELLKCMNMIGVYILYNIFKDIFKDMTLFTADLILKSTGFFTSSYIFNKNDTLIFGFNKLRNNETSKFFIFLTKEINEDGRLFIKGLLDNDDKEDGTKFDDVSFINVTWQAGSQWNSYTSNPEQPITNYGNSQLKYELKSFEQIGTEIPSLAGGNPIQDKYYKKYLKYKTKYLELK